MYDWFSWNRKHRLINLRRIWERNPSIIELQYEKIPSSESTCYFLKLFLPFLYWYSSSLRIIDFGYVRRESGKFRG